MTIRKLISSIIRPFRRFVWAKLEKARCKKEARRFTMELEKTSQKRRIIYLGITQHKNLGDLAQHYCIRRWIESQCNDYTLVMTDAPTIVASEYGALDALAKMYNQDDVIIFQSGYTTQDLGGVHDLMHRMVAEKLSYAKILMMPQTIYFQQEENKRKTSQALNACLHMLFLARDYTSYGMATEMFPDIQVKAYPDIVTSLIGNFEFNNNREKIFLCRRNDGEKFYSENELVCLKNRLQSLAPVEIGDTQSHASMKQIMSNLQGYIEKEIERYSHYKVTVTDRYHGTIFSLCAGTPVVIIKTTDHKVTTGADWFKGVYDGYVTVANDLDDAYLLAEQIVKNKKDYPKLDSYFENHYYGQQLCNLLDSLN